ncbi:hypothetical protein EVAR_33265_1 [Eumeta japonica]|uniref:Uncharacterized protein n=1 Tax=Eumeta variegata TaxID=151549 RepID=A0A4C1X0E8_EUMVA|nr:hypothetical protein EVAR_33265_1 [Eumeta japonica]
MNSAAVGQLRRTEKEAAALCRLSQKKTVPAMKNLSQENRRITGEKIGSGNRHESLQNHYGAVFPDGRIKSKAVVKSSSTDFVTFELKLNFSEDFNSNIILQKLETN